MIKTKIPIRKCIFVIFASNILKLLYGVNYFVVSKNLLSWNFLCISWRINHLFSGFKHKPGLEIIFKIFLKAIFCNERWLYNEIYLCILVTRIQSWNVSQLNLPCHANHAHVPEVLISVRTKYLYTFTFMLKYVWTGA